MISSFVWPQPCSLSGCAVSLLCPRFVRFCVVKAFVTAGVYLCLQLPTAEAGKGSIQKSQIILCDLLDSRLSSNFFRQGGALESLAVGHAQSTPLCYMT